MKKLLILLLAMFMVLSLAACGTEEAEAPTTQPENVYNENVYNENAYNENAYSENADTAETYNGEAPQERIEPQATPEPAPDDPSAALIGTWLWMGSPYYVFESDGRGTMNEMEISWSTNNGVLSICNTPEVCGSTCIAPAEWNYTIQGNDLTLRSTLMPDLIFSYTRR